MARKSKSVVVVNRCGCGKCGVCGLFRRRESQAIAWKLRDAAKPSTMPERYLDYPDLQERPVQIVRDAARECFYQTTRERTAPLLNKSGVSA